MLMQEGNRFHNYLLLHLIVFIWGFTAILGALISIEAVPLVWYRMLLAVGFIVIYFLVKRKSLKVDKRGVAKFVFSGIIIAVHWITFFKAIKVSNVSVALVTMSTGAFFTSLIEPLFFKRKVKLLEICLGLLVVLGLYVIFNFESRYTLGIIYALVSAFLSALFSVLNGLYVRDYDPELISFYQLFFGVIGITFFLLFTNSFSIDFFTLSKADWGYLFVLSSICTAYAFIISVRVMKYLTPYTVMLTINLEPIYAIILALLIFKEKEQMDVGFYYGAFIVLFVVLLNGILKNKRLGVQKEED
ncbi:Protein containing DUF6 [Tenacibaculum maritimum NCIMB 2154]|uniref:Protein containing DUF6 n=2 Tax=Tenacibaculum maritimum TaxID=107401 RepID=A0A2H1EA53_9FLAO|nr:Protein containing DUF6 [Tenacibaculum maritimum NCIMB 2154]